MLVFSLHKDSQGGWTYLATRKAMNKRAVAGELGVRSIELQQLLLCKIQAAFTRVMCRNTTELMRKV